MNLNLIKPYTNDIRKIINAFYECKGCDRCDIAHEGDISDLCLLLEYFKNDMADRIKKVLDDGERR